MAKYMCKKIRHYAALSVNGTAEKYYLFLIFAVFDV